ncbi:MAG: efflux transporter outer membrane subunit [Zoogloeaceae bacterium]|jgi:multidrug efflux system outer membrane protein|nr:efflux transporter outer membrane subunit [Zoogloeaceae bacterium]
MTNHKTFFPFGGVLAAALFAAGCAVGPDYARPENPLPETYASVPDARAETAAPVNPRWWTLFQDETLNTLVEQGLAANHDLSAAAARLEAARAASRVAWGDYFPNVDLTGSSIRNRTSGKTATGKQMGVMTSTNRRLALEIGYELDLWGRIRRSNEAANADALAGEYARDALRLTVAGMIANEYLNLRMLDAEIEATDAIQASWTRTADLVKARRDAGVSSELDWQQTRAAQAAAEAQWHALQRFRNASETQLGLLTAQPDLTIAAYPKSEEGNLRRERFERLPLPVTPPPGLPSTLLEARPDVREAEERLIAANARIGVARAAWFPSISLTGLFGNESSDISNLFGSGTNVWSYGAALLMPVFNAGKTGARVDQATAGQQEALANYLKTVSSAFKETRDVLSNLDHYRQEGTAYDAQLAAARKAYALANARYEAGHSSFLEPLDSLRTQNSVELAWLSNRRDRLIAAIDLFKALGGGWQPETETGDRRPETGDAR